MVFSAWGPSFSSAASLYCSITKLHYLNGTDGTSPLSQINNRGWYHDTSKAVQNEFI